MSGNLGSSAQIVGFNNNLTKIVSQLNLSNPSSYAIRGNNTVLFFGVSEDVINSIFSLKLDPNGFSGGSFINTVISDLRTNVSASGTNNVSQTQTYNKNVTNMSSQQINYNTAQSYNNVIQLVNATGIDGSGNLIRYKINGGQPIGNQIDNVTAPFPTHSTNGVQKSLSGAFISTIFCPPNVAGILTGPAAGGPSSLMGSNSNTYTP